MDNEKKDDVLNDREMDFLPLDFPEDEEEDEATDTLNEKSDIEIEEAKPKVETVVEDKEAVEIKEEQIEAEVKLEEKVEPERDKVEELPPPAKKDLKGSVSQNITGNYLPGQILQEGRVRADLSLDQVAQETKIKKGFIVALEQGDKENLPPKVYVSAYVKQLCRLYKIESSQVLHSMSDETNNKSKKVSGEILHDIEKGKQVNLQEEVRVRKFFKIVAIVLLVLGVAITFVIKFALPSGKDSSTEIDPGGPVLVEVTEPRQSITSTDLEVFLVSQPFTMSEIDLPKNN